MEGACRENQIRKRTMDRASKTKKRRRKRISKRKEAQR